MRSPLRRALAVPLCLAAVVVAIAACADSPAAPDPKARVTVPELSPHLTVVSSDVGTVESAAGPSCPTWGYFNIIVNGAQQGPFYVTPLWNNCRDFHSWEKDYLNEFYYPLLFANVYCRDVAMEMYAMVNSDTPTLRVADGAPRFPYPYNDVVLHGSTHIPQQTMAHSPWAFVSDDRVMSGFPGDGFKTIVHEVIHAWAWEVGAHMTEQDVYVYADYCYNNLGGA